MAIRNANTALSDAKKFSAIDTSELARLMEKGDLEALREETERIERKTDIFTKADERHRARTPEKVKEIKDAVRERVLKTSVYKDVVDELDKAKVGRIYVNKHQGETKGVGKIIDDLGGADNTDGSCSSLALAYAGNRAGYDVLDFRGGDSRKYFADTDNISKIAKACGGIEDRDKDALAMARRLLCNVTDVGKEYYFGIGRHAAIVRMGSYSLEYLELQDDPRGNYWHSLADYALKGELKDRFNVSMGKSGYKHAWLFSVEDLSKDKGFRYLLEYINTEESKQQKGAGGSIK
ncbi:MAG: hypothetical protein LUC44_08570 [Prevotellaceae bacterium]|nr:hypothetical protein [Prevotellaceae bacterium]